MIRSAPREPVPPETLRAVDRVIQESCGLSLTEGLPGNLEAAVAEAARGAHVTGPELIARVLARDEAAIEQLVDRAVVGESCFMRHREQLEAVIGLLPALEQGGPLLAWSAGCAGGEEPYSLSMLLLEAGREGDRIVATDVSEEALARARAGRYGQWSLRRLDAARRRRWFRQEGCEASLSEAVRDLVELRNHNLVAEPPPWTFDVVLCRNVLIYFEPAVAARVLRQVFGAVRPGGLLVVGPVELPLAAALPAEWLDAGGATLLRRPEGAGAPRRSRVRTAVEPGRRAGPASALGPLFRAARDAARSGRLQDAERIARESLGAEGGPEPWLLLAQLAEARGEAQEAAALLRQALAIDPAMPVALASLSALLRLLDRPGLSEMARADALRALDGVPDGQLLRGVEAVPAGALRRALQRAEPHPD